MEWCGHFFCNNVYPIYVFVFLQHNTFQVILMTNGTTSYSVFLYGSMNWGIQNPVLTGFNDGTHFYSLAGGANSTLRTLDATVLQFSSNVGVGGVFVFRTDSSKLIHKHYMLCTYTIPVLLCVLVLYQRVR